MGNKYLSDEQKFRRMEVMLRVLRRCVLVSLAVFVGSCAYASLDLPAARTVFSLAGEVTLCSAFFYLAPSLIGVIFYRRNFILVNFIIGWAAVIALIAISLLMYKYGLVEP